MSPITISLVEDHEDLAEALRDLFARQEDMQVYDVFPSAELALQGLPLRTPSLLVVDLRLPAMSGVELIAHVKAQHPALHILVLTMYEESDLIFEALKAGASGYLLKRAPQAELCDALRQVSRGGAPMSPSIALKVVESFRNAPGSPRRDPVKLSPRETEILNLLAEGAPYKEIAATLEVSLDTVRTHLRRIYEKLHVHSRTAAVMKFFGRR